MYVHPTTRRPRTADRTAYMRRLFSSDGLHSYMIACSYPSTPLLSVSYIIDPSQGVSHWGDRLHVARSGGPTSLQNPSHDGNPRHVCLYVVGT